MNNTTRRYPRTMNEAFKDAHYAQAIEVGYRSVFTRLRIWLRNFINR